MIEPSKFQKAIFNEVLTGSDNLIIEAVAGSGKTTTIIESIKLLPPTTKVLVCAFNKAMKEELTTKLESFSNVTVATLHSIGNRTIRSDPSSAYLMRNAKDLWKFIKELAYSNVRLTNGDKWKLTNKVNKLTSLLKNNNIKFDDKEKVLALAEFYGIELYSPMTRTNLEPYAIEMLEKVYAFNKFNFTSGSSAFDDMLWLPVELNLDLHEGFKYVFVDEVQDLNKIQHDLLTTIFPKSTRIVGVGDRKQAIYGFRGAMTNGMDKFKEQFNAKEMPLSICYRCPESHLDRVRSHVPQIEGKENNPEGALMQILTEDALDLTEPSDLVLSRTNGDLLKFLFLLLNKNKKAYIEGGDQGTKIIKKIESYNTFKTLSLYEINSRLRREEVELTAEVNTALKENNFEKINRFEKSIDDIQMCMSVIEHSSNLHDVKSLCNTYFKDKANASDVNDYIKLSSVHKAKGLEASRVFILNPDKMPHSMASMDWEIEQEHNIKYVAYTRSKFYIGEILDFKEYTNRIQNNK